MKRREFLVSVGAAAVGSAVPVDRLAAAFASPLYPPMDLSRFDTAIMSATGSVQVTQVEGPHTSAMRSDGSPVPAATSSADCPGPRAASSIKASERGSNIARITAACLSQYGADSLHAFRQALSCSFGLLTGPLRSARPSELGCRPWLR